MADARAETLATLVTSLLRSGQIQNVIESMEAQRDEDQAAGNFEQAAEATKSIETFRKYAKEFEATVEASAGAKISLRVGLVPVGTSLSIEAVDLAALSVPLSILLDSLEPILSEKGVMILGTIKEALAGNDPLDVVVGADGGRNLLGRGRAVRRAAVPWRGVPRERRGL